MSQFFQGVTAGSLPPSVPTSFGVDQIDTETPSVPAAAAIVAPVANNLRLSGDHGIQTYQLTNVPSTVDIKFVNSEVDTTDATPTTLIALPTSTDTTKTFQCLIAAYSSVGDAIGAWFTAVIKNVGGTVSIVNTVDITTNKDAALAAANIEVDISGTTFIITVTGVVGKNIKWNCCFPGIVST